jgi:hypothetical protein
VKSGKLLLLLFCAFGCVSTVAILFRTPALRESATPVSSGEAQNEAGMSVLQQWG